MAEMETFGSSIQPYVAKQIKDRQTALSSESKDRNQILLLNSATSWAKFRSSVNKISEGDSLELLQKQPKRNITGDSRVAQNYVLLGGTLNPESRTPRAGILRSATSDNPNAGGRPAALNRDTEAYLNYESTGFRPMPGLTSISVSHKNTYGTLLQATVKFTVWSKEQLEDVELLYFRPGYTALLEWGHSVFLKNGTVEFANDSMTVPEGVYFKAKTGKDKILEEIEERRRLYEGNYQGMFGFITNFQWSFRSDGGYDCEVKLVSLGIILESLKSSNPSQHLSEEEIKVKEEEEKKDREATKRRYKSTFHAIFETLKEYDFAQENEDGVEILREQKYTNIARQLTAQFENIKTIYGEKNKFNVINYRLKVNEEDEGYLKALFGDDNLAYISMRSFLGIINAFEIMKDPSGTNELSCPFALGYGNKYTTHQNHFSVNPLYAIVPKVPVDSKLKKFVVGDTNNSSNAIAKKLSGNRDNDIQNIYISSMFILQEINRIIDGVVDEGVGIYDFVKNILAGIQQAYGNINNFDIHFDETTQQYQIIDRGAPAALSFPKIERINVTGIANTVVDLQVTSKISKEMSSQVSIAAQGHTGNYKENLQNILQWNKGAIDRHILSKEQTEKESTNSKKEEANREQILKKIEEAYDDIRPTEEEGNALQKAWGKVTRFFSPIKVEDIVNMAGEASAINSYYLYDARVNKSISDPLPIPISLSLKLYGISGFKIGTVFTINSLILPKAYRNYGYIISGVSHEIGTDNKWYTTVEAFMYKIKL